MWARVLSSGILIILVALVVASMAVAWTSSDEDEPNHDEPSPHQQFIEELEEWNREFEQKMHEPSPPPVDTKIVVDERQQRLVDNILHLSPKTGHNRSRYIAELIIANTDSYDIPHENFVAAIIQRESNFAQRVEDGRRRGALGEIGLMQIMPHGYAIQLGNDCEQTTAHCNIMTGVRFLQKTISSCESNDPWVWMAAYTSGKCTTSRLARQQRGAIKSRQYFCEITPECDDLWPR